MEKTFGRAAFEKVPMSSEEFAELCKDENIRQALNNLIQVINIKKKRTEKDFYMMYSIISIMEIYCKFLKEVPQNEILNSIFVYYKKLCWEGVEKNKIEMGQ